MYYADDCWLLGSRQLAVAAYHGDAIRLHSTPERWLRAGRVGVVILNWGIDCRDLFEGVERVECNSPQLEQMLRRGLRRWEPPLASVREAAHAT